jgi:hypothetical protein
MGSALSDWCGSWSSLTDPTSAAVSMVLCAGYDYPKTAAKVTTAAADVYQQAVYGNVPTVASLPPAPAPNAPQTQTQMTDAQAWTVAQSAVTPEQWDAWSESQRQAIADAIASGDYNPAGNIPSFTSVSDFLAQYKTPLLIGGALLGGLLVFSSVRR